MSTLSDWLYTAAGQARLAELYPPHTLEAQTQRYAALIARFRSLYGEDPVMIVSSPGRTEIAGNHTDHNHGQVLCAAVDIDILAAVSPRPDSVICLQSDGFEPATCDIRFTEPVEREQGTPLAILRGMAAGLREDGFQTGGFNAAATSNVRAGSGLSSSAAFEVLIAAIQDALFNGSRQDAIARARMAQATENRYFGKPSGLMDQMACSVGGFIHIDFAAEPRVEQIPFSLDAFGMDLIIVNTSSSHDNLTNAYAAIPREMKAVAAHFGAQVLSQVPEDTFMAQLPDVRKAAGDRAVLRSMHFYAENRRVEQLTAALKAGSLEDFLRLIIASGRSSFEYLQNVYASPETQPLSLALALAENMLSGCGAWRVHGGGFAGTTQNFVPRELTPAFIARMEAVFGPDCCQVLRVRPWGPVVAARAD